MNLNINSSDLDKFISDAISKSFIGEIITKTLVNLLYSAHNPVEQALKPIVYNIAYDLIQDKFQAQIKEQLTRIIEESITEEMTKEVVKAAAKQMIKAMQQQNKGDI